MTTIALPSWFDVAECEAQLVPEVRGFPGPYGGPTEVQDLLGDRWQLRLTLPDGNHGHGAQSEALFNRLHGGADWLRLHHFARPVPRGTARGSLTLAAAMAQGANALSLAGVTSSTNLQLDSGFEIDSNSDGLSDGLTIDSSGSTGAISYSRGVGNGSPFMQQVVAAALVAGALVRARFNNRALGAFAGQAVTCSIDVYGTGATNILLEMAWFDGSGASISASFATESMPSVWTRRSATFTAPAGAAQAQFGIYLANGSGGLSYANLDNAQVEIGSAATAYQSGGAFLTGDMLGHNGEQLFQVAEDARADDAGNVGLVLVNRARKAISSGQAIVWDKPQVPFQLMSPGGVATAYTRGRARGQQVEFVEAWA